jgi:hypothetical protein
MISAFSNYHYKASLIRYIELRLHGVQQKISFPSKASRDANATAIEINVRSQDKR